MRAGAPRGVRLFAAGAPLEAAREHPPSKDDVRQIVPREIGELVPGIVAHELKSLRQELQKDIEGIDDRLETLEALYSNLRGEGDRRDPRGGAGNPEASRH